MNRTLTAVLLTAMLLLTAVAPAAVSAQESTNDTTDLALELTQDPETGNATVTVTNASGVVENATVNVTSDAAYAGNGTYETDENGTVELPNPAQTVEIDVEATSNGTTTTETFTLVPVEESIDVAISQNDDGSVLIEVTQYGEALENATVNVTSDVAYEGNGTYETDANGTVDLVEPTASTELTADVTSGELEASETATVEPIAEFEVSVSANDDGTATVTVTRDDAVVDNATVNVTSDVAYAGNGTYETDANGTVDLPEPDQTVNVTVTATDGDDEATTTATLEPVDTGLAVDVVQNSDGSAVVTVTDDGDSVENATVNVTSDVAYAGNGTYETDDDGTVDLPNPEQNVTITVTAINDSEETTTTAELEAIDNGGFSNFGLWISSYVHQLQEEGYFGPEFGQKVSDFATSNNPGADNKPEHAGKPENAGPKDDAGPPSHAKNDKDDAGASNADADEDESDCDEESTSSNDDPCEVDGESDDERDNGRDKGNNGNGNNGNGNGGGPKK